MDSTQRSMFVDFDEYNIRRHWIQALLNSCGRAWTDSPKDSHSSSADTTACGFDIMLCGAMHLSAAIPPPTLILASLAECCPSEHSMLKTSTFNNVHWWWTDPAHIGMSTAGWRTDDAMRPSSHCLTRQLSITFTDGELILRTLECQLRVDEPMMLCDHLAKLPSFVWAIRKLCFILQP